MMYPRKTPKQAKEAEDAKKLATLQQREQLLLLASQKFPNRYPSKQSEPNLSHYASVGSKPRNTSELKEADHHIKHIEQEQEAGLEEERGNLSARSNASRMSGATDHSHPEELNETKIRKDGLVIDLTMSPTSKGKKVYKNEEEEWADIYKSNHEAFQAELAMKKERKAFDTLKFREVLDGQKSKNLEKKGREQDLRRIDHQQVMLKIEREENKEKKKAELEKAKTEYLRDLREQQMKSVKAQRKHEVKEQKQLDNYIVSRIREEQQELEKAAKQKRQEDKTNYRRLLAENEEKRQKIFEAKELERKAEIKQIEEHVKLIEQREKARADEVRAKDERIRRNIELAKELIGKPQDDRERNQETKLKKWTEQRELEEKIADMNAKQYVQKRRQDNKAFLEQQIEEVKQKREEEKKRRNEQAEIWRTSNEKYAEWEKAKNEDKKEQMRLYSETLQQQMQEKFEQKRVTDKLYDLRMSLEENKRAFVK